MESPRTMLKRCIAAARSTPAGSEIDVSGYATM